MTKIITTKNRLHTIRQIQESITETSNTSYYVFVSDHSDHSNATLQTIYDSEREIRIDPYRNMIFGKRVSNSDVSILIRNIPYVANAVYDMYDDNDPDLLEKDFFAIVDGGANFHVYKCLDNNMGAYSTVEPDFSHISGANTSVYQTSDGYRWKYMFSVDSTTEGKFSTDTLFPVVANTTVQNAAVGGTIDIIKVDGAGRGYDNFTTGTFSSSHLRIGGNSTIYEIGNTSVSTTNGFYTGCLLYLSAGTGSGQYKKIVNYYSNSIGNYMVVNSEFTVSPTNSTEYQIYPEVLIIGGGSQSTNAVARAMINAVSGNSVYRVEMLNRGAGYTYATATVAANATVDVSSNAIVRPIYSPYHGHGYDAAEELGAKHISFSVKFSNSESNTITIDNKFQQIGIMKNPRFANVVIQLQSSNGVFSNSEIVYKISPVRLATNASINTTSNVVTCSVADFSGQLSSGQRVYLKSSNGTSHQLATVGSVTNTSHLTLTSNGYWSCTETTVYAANVSTNGTVIAVNSTYMTVNNVLGTLSTSDIMIGQTSGAKMVVNAVSRSGTSKNFNTFMNMHKYVGTLDSGTFEENEIVYQGSIMTSNALLHSSNVDGGVLTLYCSNQVGLFVADGLTSVVGNTSGATATITERYGPELVFGSGDVLFLENVDVVTRSSNTNETIQTIFGF